MAIEFVYLVEIGERNTLKMFISEMNAFHTIVYI